MAERSFKKEVEHLRLGAGQVFHGEGILAVTKALLENGVSYVGGYQGSPISHLMDVFSDAQPLLKELGVLFESSASEAAAASMLSASVMYPVRGAVTWKSTVGTNVASDALSNLASGGVTGGTVIIIGEDYGEGSSIMQERTHAFAMKSQIWLIDPKPNLESIVKAVEHAFLLSEASNTPVFLQLRVRSCHLYGQFIAKNNQSPKVKISDCLNNPKRDNSRIVLPPASFLHEQEKIKVRMPAALQFIKDNALNEHIVGEKNDIGIIVLGGLFNNLNRALTAYNLSDHLGNINISTFVLNVAYPLHTEEIVDFCKDKKGILVIEEAQPNYVEQNIAYIVHQHNLKTKIYGKNVLPLGGDYTIDIIKKGLNDFLNDFKQKVKDDTASTLTVVNDADKKTLTETIPVRPAGFCTGCPERPIFAALKLVQQNLGEHHVSGDIGCHIFSILPPFNIGTTTMGYGLGASSASAFNLAHFTSSQGQKRPIAFMGDGGFWHNGLATGIGNAVFNQFDGVIVIVDNNYAAATGGQDILSTRTSFLPWRKTNNPIEKAVRGVGVEWVKFIDNTYDVQKMVQILTESLVTNYKGPKVIIAQSECSLNKVRREKSEYKKTLEKKQRAVKERFGVDEKICTGDHECMRLSGCPSLTLGYSTNPLREDPIAKIDYSCVACGNCGEVAEAAVLCPSFYKATLVHNPTWTEKISHVIRRTTIRFLQKRRRHRYSLASI